MQQKKNIRLIISLVILLGATGFAYWFNLDETTLKVDKTIFRVNDLKVVDKITFESTHGRVELKLNGVRWKVNDRFDADRNLVEVLFATLQQAEPKRPVASVLQDSISKKIKSEGVKVSLFASNNMIKSFYAGGNAAKTQAYFKTDEGDSYIVVIPGYRVYTAGILELTENDWREKRIFNFNWRNFKDLSTVFPTEPNQNFKITFQDKYFGIVGLTQSDTTKLNNYLDAVSLLSADQFINQQVLKGYDSLMNTQPAMKIEVRDIADRMYNLTIYHHVKNSATVLGKTGDDFVLFNFQKVAPIVRGSDYFRVKK